MPQHNGFHAWISIDGQPAPEYSVEVSEDGTNVTCWVASELGKKFTVQWTNKTYYGLTATGGYLALDGSALRAGYFLVRCLVATCTFHQTPVDDDSLLGGPSHPDLGIIALEIVPVHLQAGGIRPQAAAPAVPSALAQKLKVHERAKKAVTQQVGLGQAEPSQPSSFVASVDAGPPVVKFCWRYRPLDILRANGIAPAENATLKRKAEDEGSRPAPTLPPKKEKEVLKNKSNVSSSSNSNTSANKKPRIKDEKQNPIDLTESKPTKVKKEKTVTRRTYVKGEVIDLT
uniref:Uncharacterized protein n=1 Tax=Mycena chlorophos TaxID=658473 RepID=A0ABQ0L8W3_MYCCL|nr:predicted protein [Mycena chlorophos]